MRLNFRGTNFVFNIYANAGGCSSHTEKKAEIECFSDDKKCIEATEKESLYKVEA